MKDINSITLLGRAGKDAETITTPGGTEITTFSMATGTYLGKNQDGSAKIDTEWTDVKCFGYVAKDASDIRKGDRVTVIGRKKTESWEKDGGKRYRTLVYADVVQIGLLPAKDEPF